MTHISNTHFSRLISLMVLALGLLLLANNALAQDKDPAHAWQMIEDGALIVDVRTAEEFAADHLDNAINIPFEQITTEFSSRNIDKNQAVVVYCRSGRRSGIAQQALTEAGYAHTYNGGGLVQLQQNKP
ncbi:rhodanese-like domain-containing protein [Shewanella waksmanii]|uniref:rhodanese-like domain-containing protein n=1 Tax=Shewanella waksmanii TaxID=213783 RepID=UPI00048D8BB1